MQMSDLRETVRGAVVSPEEGDYDNSRSVHNAMHDRRPAAIVHAADTADVIATLRWARDNDLAIAVRGGGHSVPGFGTCDGGVVIDLGPIRNVRVDPAGKTARVGGGATWGDLDHATHPFGLATTGGVVSTTGVAGLTLGGGIGHLTRSCGLSLDNLLSADVVTADGRAVVVSDFENPDLFWALRGGGGNFGVVTSMEFQLHPCDTVVGGPLFYDAADAGAVLSFYREFIAEAPEELGCFFGWHLAPPLPFIPDDRVGMPACVLVACWNGPADEAEAALKPLHDVAEVVGNGVMSVPYPALNSAFDPLVPPGLQNYWKADFVTELTDDAISAHIEHGPRIPHVSSAVHIHPINGAVDRVGADETAFGHRDKTFAAVIAGVWPDPADNDANVDWVRDYYDAIHPHSGTDGGYVNFMSDDDAHRAPANYGVNHDRLRDVKATWDPDNVFRLNQNIVPAS